MHAEDLHAAHATLLKRLQALVGQVGRLIAYAGVPDEKLALKLKLLEHRVQRQTVMVQSYLVRNFERRHGRRMVEPPVESRAVDPTAHARRYTVTGEPAVSASSPRPPITGQWGARPGMPRSR